MTDLESINLQDMQDLIVVHFNNESDWLDLRRKGIGGSDIGALMGLNKYSSPLEVYRQKVEGYVKDLSNNVNVRKGKDLEDFILKTYVTPWFVKNGFTSIIKPDFMLVNTNFEYLRANIDGMAFTEGQPSSFNVGVEIKYVSMNGEAAWEDGNEYGGIPASYYAQCQLYMAVTGLNRWVICPLFETTWQVHFYVIERNEEFIDKLKATAKEFYEKNMQYHIPPNLNYEIDKDAVVAESKKELVLDTPDETMTDYINRYLELSAQIKGLSKEADEIKSRVMNLHLQGKYPSDTRHYVKLTNVVTHKFNSSKFKEEHPAEYEDYCEDVESSRLTIK